MAALSKTSPVSPEIGLLAELISQNTGEEGLTLPLEKAENLLTRLHVLKRRIANLEHELGAYRVTEQDQAVGGVLGDLCLEVMQEGVLDAAKEETVIRPDFRKGKRS